jgi:hypothetical protein
MPNHGGKKLHVDDLFNCGYTIGNLGGAHTMRVHVAQPNRNKKEF